jgi:hypothetical protein
MDISELLACAMNSDMTKWAPQLALTLLKKGAVFNKNKLLNDEHPLWQALSMGLQLGQFSNFAI